MRWRAIRNGRERERTTADDQLVWTTTVDSGRPTWLLPEEVCVVTRIVLAEPNFIRREALQQLLLELGAEVVAVRSAAEAVQELSTSPGVLLLDGSIDGSIALDRHALEQLLLVPDLRVILVLWRRQHLASWTERIGVLGVVELTGEEADVRASLWQVAHGEAAQRPAVASPSEVSRHELYVLLGVASGRSSQEMAQALGIPRRSVDALRGALLRRMRVNGPA